MIYLKLFWSFLQIGLFSFGGGYAALPLIEDQVVTINNWLTQEEFIDLFSISQMTPGPIAINAATFVGQKVGGFTGALVATFGNILPSCVILIIIAHFYVKFQNATILVLVVCIKWMMIKNYR
jgi:chromate transporter